MRTTGSADKMIDVANPPADCFPERDYDGDPDLADEMIEAGMMCQGVWADAARRGAFRVIDRGCTTRS